MNIKTTAAALAVCIVTGCTPEPGESQVSGEALYATSCAACHGVLGEGDGPVADVMRVSMPNLRNLSVRNNGEFPTESVRAYIDGRELPAAHGDRYMPVWGNVFGWREEAGAETEEAIAARIDT